MPVSGPPPGVANGLPPVYSQQPYPQPPPPQSNNMTSSPSPYSQLPMYNQPLVSSQPPSIQYQPPTQQQSHSAMPQQQYSYHHQQQQQQQQQILPSYQYNPAGIPLETSPIFSTPQLYTQTPAAQYPSDYPPQQQQQQYSYQQQQQQQQQQQSPSILETEIHNKVFGKIVMFILIVFLSISYSCNNVLSLFCNCVQPSLLLFSGSSIGGNGIYL